MADAKTQIVSHKGRIVVMNGNIVMGPCEPNKFYVRLMVGDETMEDWWWRVGMEGPENYLHSYYAYPGITFTPPEKKGYTEEGSSDHGWYRYWYGDYSGMSPVGITTGVLYLGRKQGFPSTALYRDGSYLYAYNEEYGDYEARFTTRRRGSSEPEGILDVGTYVVAMGLVAKGSQDYKIDAHDDWNPTADKHYSGTNDVTLGGSAYFKFVISRAGKGDPGLAGSGINVEIIGFGDWNRETRFNVGTYNLITDPSFVPRLEIFRQTKDKDGSTKEEVVWQSE